MAETASEDNLMSGQCPDAACNNTLRFFSSDHEVECTKCGQTHPTNNIKDVEVTKVDDHNLPDLFCDMITDRIKSGRKDSEAVKVNGLSNYQCRLVSELLTRFGLDKTTGKAKLLKDLLPDKREAFDCSKLANHAFTISEEHLNTNGYGIDCSALKYLKETLQKIKEFNGKDSCPLVPLYADGDGYCLVHAISRCLVGRELFWHPLMTEMHLDLLLNQDKYQMQFGDFFTDKEFQRIIEEASPDYKPDNDEQLGLRNIHIFSLANVLRRPIILMDPLVGSTGNAEYSGLFLPTFVEPELCITKKGTKNKPIVIAWSNAARNHFVPLVCVKDIGDCQLPENLLPEAWGVNQLMVAEYIEFNDNSSCTIGNGASIQDSYLKKLVCCMEKKFEEINEIAASTVADYYHHVVKPKKQMSVTDLQIIGEAKKAVEEELLHKCIRCGRVCQLEIPESTRTRLLPDGELYQTAKEGYGGVLLDGFEYLFQKSELICRYDEAKDRFFVHQMKTCESCNGSLRVISNNGSIAYRNGDMVQGSVDPSRVTDGEEKCFWNDKLYDYPPEKVPVKIDYNGKTFTENIAWFYKEKDPSRNSDPVAIAQRIVLKHFPEDISSDFCVTFVVNQILAHTSHLVKDNLGYDGLTWNYYPYGNQSSSVGFTNEPARQSNGGAIPRSTTKKTVKVQPPVSKDANTASENSYQAKVFADTNQSTKCGENIIGPSTNGKKIETQKQRDSQKKISQGKEGREISAQKDQEQEGKTACNVRLTFKGQNETIKVTNEMKFKDLRIKIKEIFKIDPEAQIIKTGFPPKEFQQPLDENDPIGLKHGERLFIEEKLGLHEKPHGKGRGTKRGMKKQDGGKNTGKRVGYRLGTEKDNSTAVGRGDKIGGKRSDHAITKKEKRPCQSNERKDQRGEILAEKEFTDQSDTTRKSENEAGVDEQGESPEAWRFVEMNDNSTGEKSDGEAPKETIRTLVEDMERNIKSLKDEEEGKDRKESINVDVFFQEFREMKDKTSGEITVEGNFEAEEVDTSQIMIGDQTKESTENNVSEESRILVATDDDVVLTDKTPSDSLNPNILSQDKDNLPQDKDNLSQDKDNPSSDEDKRSPDTLSPDTFSPNSIPSNEPMTIKDDLDVAQQDSQYEAEEEMAFEFVNKEGSAAEEINEVPMGEAESEREVDQNLASKAESERDVDQP